MKDKMAEKLNDEQARQILLELPDESLRALTFSMPWQYNPDTGERLGSPDVLYKDTVYEDRDKLQTICWEKFNRNPQVNTAVRGLVGRLTGLGFSTTSSVARVNDVIREIETDPRNRLYNFWPKYVGRSIIEGELFLLLSVDDDGFVEVDFIDPGNVTGFHGNADGIIWHPKKALMPMFYHVKDGSNDDYLFPSIYAAYYPNEINGLLDDSLTTWANRARDSRPMFKSIGGFRQFVVSWDKGFVTKRAVSYLQTTLEWLNHYENLKKYEVDHKKASGAYLWTFEFDDIRAFKTWLSLTDAERKKTGISAELTPGGRLYLPPGMKCKAEFPNLPRISDTDTDILQMVTSGLNESEDVSTGSFKGTYASIKESRGPMSDRTSDEIAWFERFLRYDFWRAIFFLKSKTVGFPKTFSVREAVGFEKQKPQFKNVQKTPEETIEFNFPSSEINDMENRAKALLGVKHGRLADDLGIPESEVAKKLGFGNYKELRLKKATEDDIFPELMPEVDQALIQNPSGSSGPNNGESATAKKSQGAK